MEFAEGKWTPFVFFGLEERPDAIPEMLKIEFTDVSESGIRQALKSLPSDITDFAGFVRDEIEKREKTGD